jgi:hypothetical protein
MLGTLPRRRLLAFAIITLTLSLKALQANDTADGVLPSPRIGPT